jgi:hypothetical protein
MPGISDYRKNMPPSARFKSSQELQDLVRARVPFYVTQIFEGTGTFNGKEVKKWNLRCVPMMGGAEFLFSLGKTGYRDGLVANFLQPEIDKNQKAGPLILTFGINKSSGRPMYDLEDFVPGAGATTQVTMPVTPAPAMPAAPVSVVSATPKEYTAYCPKCSTYPVTIEPFEWNGKQYVTHACSVSGQAELLAIEAGVA